MMKLTLSTGLYLLILFTPNARAFSAAPAAKENGAPSKVARVIAGEAYAASVRRPHGVDTVPVAKGAPEEPIRGRLKDTTDPTDALASRLRRLSALELDEVVWLARCIYSESDRAHEQELVAWVVRNRVETQYRGTTYREVVLENRQFSAFNNPTQRRKQILSLDHNSTFRPWRQALNIALNVYFAPSARRPFAQTVRHFYSPISMSGGRAPHWADRDKALSSARLGVDWRRFIFFNDVDETVSARNVVRGDLERTAQKARYEANSSVQGSRRSGIKLKLPRPSGKVSRPRRPSM